MEILNTLTQSLGGEVLGNISRQTGIDQGQAGSVLGAALPILLGALAKNTSQGQGANELHNALAKDHDGSILDDLGGFLSNANQGPGAGILKHVLGGRRPGVEQAISKQTGVDTSSIASILEIAAPIVMGALGKKQRTSNIDAGGMADLLRSGAADMTRQSPQGSNLINQLLDQDGDGDISDDVTRIGFNLLGKFLK